MIPTKNVMWIQIRVSWWERFLASADVFEAFDLMECYAVYVGTHPPKFWDSMISPHHQRSSSPRGARKLQYTTTNIQCLKS